jgi:hypothetical protein
MISKHFNTYATIETRKLLEASARGLTFAMADVISGALLCEHSAWSEAKAKARPSDAIAVAEATVDRVVAQRWCEGMERKIAYQIEALGNEARYEEDRLMLFGLTDARTSSKVPVPPEIASRL